MGSGFYSFEEAAARLGKSKRSLHVYVEQGRLKKLVEGGKKVLDRESVDLMAVDLQEGLQPMNRKTLFKLQSTVTKLAEEMRAVKHALELRDAPPYVRIRIAVWASSRRALPTEQSRIKTSSGLRTW